MRRIHLYGSLFWLLFALITCIEAYRLNLGEIEKPGPGLFPFAVGLVMLGLSLAALFQSMGKKPDLEKTIRQEPIRWWNIVIILAAIVAYALTLEKVGFLVSTFVFIGLLLKVVEPQPWRTVLLGAVITSIGANLLFNVIFRAQIPSGIWGF